MNKKREIYFAKIDRVRAIDIIKTKKKYLLSLFFVFLNPSLSGASENIIASREKVLNIMERSKIGFCRSDKQVVDMRDLLRLKNDKVWYLKKERALRIDREKVYLEHYNDSGSLLSSDIFDLGSVVSEKLGVEDADISLEVALLNNDFVIFWSETFKHKPQKLGVYQLIDGKGISSICSGHRGISKSK